MTSLKQVALVTIAALGFGVLTSVVPSSAATQADSLTLSSATASQFTGETATATSATVIFTFDAVRQSALSITTSNSSNYAKGTTGVSLTTSGGSGSGAISYLTPSAGCTISGSRLTVATSYGSGTTVICSVVANKASNGIYMANTTAPAKVFSFR